MSTQSLVGRVEGPDLADNVRRTFDGAILALVGITKAMRHVPNPVITPTAVPMLVSIDMDTRAEATNLLLNQG